MASTMPNMVSVLMENPATARTPNVPSNTTGTAIVGINVARKFCRNRYMTRKTRTIASNRVLTTSWMEIRTNGVVSNGSTACSPGGKKGFRVSIVSLTALAVSSALAPGASFTARPAAGLPLYLVLTE
jgi:hypothetical protein